MTTEPLTAVARTSALESVGIFAGRAWQRVELWLSRAGDWLNPILVKETRQALKSRQFVITFLLVLGACLGTCLVPSGRAGVVVDTTSECIQRVALTRSTRCDGAMEMWLGRRPGNAAPGQPVAVRRAVNASRRWFHWQLVQTSTT